MFLGFQDSGFFISQGLHWELKCAPVGIWRYQKSLSGRQFVSQAIIWRSEEENAEIPDIVGPVYRMRAPWSALMTDIVGCLLGQTTGGLTSYIRASGLRRQTYPFQFFFVSPSIQLISSNESDKIGGRSTVPTHPICIYIYCLLIYVAWPTV